MHLYEIKGGLLVPRGTESPGRGSPPRARATPFRPEDHLRILKQGQTPYLDVKWRLVWFREEHPEGFVRTTVLEHDAKEGLAVMRAEVGYLLPDGTEVLATGHGTETRKEFGDYLPKAETAAVGRALAHLGYGTALATELDEGEHEDGSRNVVDSPGERRGGGPVRRQRQAPGEEQDRASTARAPRGRAFLPPAEDEAPMTREQLRATVEALLAADPDAAGRLPKSAAELNEAELAKTLAWLRRRERALGVGA